MIVLSIKLLLSFVPHKIPYFQVVVQLFAYRPFLLLSDGLFRAAFVSLILASPVLSVVDPIVAFLLTHTKCGFNGSTAFLPHT